jgi:hypothetical protein
MSRWRPLGVGWREWMILVILGGFTTLVLWVVWFW